MIKFCLPNSFDSGKAREILSEIDSLVSEYIMVGGTLLSCVRHGSFMPWDDDIDILVDFDIMTEHVNSGTFSKAGYNVELDFLDEEEHYLLKLIKNGILTDIWPCRIHPDDESMLQTVGGNYPIDKTWPVQRVEFEGGFYPIPSDPYYYLDRNIGENWRHQIRKRLDGKSTLYSIEKFNGPIYLESLKGRSSLTTVG